MELTHLKYFIRLANVLNFSEAARQLFITQSTLSQSIRQTEEFLGIPLFERIGKKVYLTEAGKEFLPYAEEAIGSVKTGVQRLRDIQEVYKGELRIGVIYSLCPMLAKCAASFSERYPDVRLSLIQSSSIYELTDMVHKHHIDFAFSYTHKTVSLSPLITATDLFRIPLCLVVDSKSPFAAFREITMAEVGKQDLALLENGTYLRKIIEKIANKNGVRLLPKSEINDSNLLLQLVRTGQWNTIGLREAAIQFSDLVAIPIKEVQEELTASLLWLKDGYQKSAAKKFIQIIIDAGQRHHTLINLSNKENL